MTNLDTSATYRVDTTPRLAQWRIDNIAACTYRKSNPFKMGIWNWYLSIEKSKLLLVKLFPETSTLTRETPPIASFAMRAISLSSDRRVLRYPEVRDKQMKNAEDFVWPIEASLTGKLIIDVEFLDLKASRRNGGDPCSIWGEDLVIHRSNATLISCLNKMLGQGIHTDITINAANGSARAHRAILAARSPVFCSMFGHDLREKELSAVDVPDMTVEACEAFLRYMYGGIEMEEFMDHRMALLAAAEKYCVPDLKEACHDSLVEDIDTKNVLERLQSAALYGLPRLKRDCLDYLVKFGKIFDLREEFEAFALTADRDLIGEVFLGILDSWKGF